MPPNGSERQFDGRRAGGDHDCFGADDLRAGLRLDVDRLAVAELRPAVDDLDLALLQQPATPLVSRPTMPSFQPSSSPDRVRAAGRNAERAFAGRNARDLREFVGGVDQRLGGDAADVEAGAAELSSPRRSPCRGRAVRRGWRRHSRPGPAPMTSSLQAMSFKPQPSMKIIAGVSSSALMRCTNRAASQPSTTR